VIEPLQAERLARVVGFRSAVVHQCTPANLQIVEAVIVAELDQLLESANRIWQHLRGAAS
jgi:uncharacterized protein YutE (UPF0331/DUF86 family)